MSLVRRAKQRDLNEPGLVDRLEAFGAIVFRLDVPFDLLVQCAHGVWHVFEVKNPSTLKHRKKSQPLTADQFKAQRLLARPVPVIVEIEDAIAVLVSECGRCERRWTKG